MDFDFMLLALSAVKTFLDLFYRPFIHLAKTFMIINKKDKVHLLANKIHVLLIV